MSDKGEQDRLDSIVSALLASETGRDFVYEVLNLCGIYDNQFTGNSSTFFNEGRRSVGIDILRMMSDVDPTAYPRMLLERAKLEDRND